MKLTMAIEDGFDVVLDGSGGVADHNELEAKSFQGDFGRWEALRDCSLEKHEGDKRPPSSPVAGTCVEGLCGGCNLLAKESSHSFQGRVGGRGFGGVEGHGLAVGDLELGERARWGEYLLTDFCWYVRGDGGEVDEGRYEAAGPFGVVEERRSACVCVCYEGGFHGDGGGVALCVAGVADDSNGTCVGGGCRLGDDSEDARTARRL